MKHLFGALAASALTFACVAGGDHIAASPGPDEQMISLARAIEIAQAKVPDGVPVRAHLEKEDDEGEPPAYEVQLWVESSHKLMEVEVHAYTGAVLEVEVEDDGPQAKDDDDDDDDDDGEDDDDGPDDDGPDDD